MAAVAEQGRKPIHESTPVEARLAGAASWAMYGTGPAMESVSNEVLTSADGGRFGVRVLRPSAAPRSVVVYCHGGGWVLGDIEGFDTLGRQLAVESNSVVVLVNYRKAPENPFPAAVEDTWAALEWVSQNLEAIAGRRVPVVIGGDSAGGNLAAVAALRARDRGGPELAHLLLVYPVTDSDTTRDSYLDPANQLLLTREGMEWFFDHYVSRADRTHPEVSPLRVADLGGLPPTTVVTAEHDPLRDEGEAFAARLVEAGVPTESRLFTGQLHGFFSMINVLPASADAVSYLAGRLRESVGAVGDHTGAGTR
ncbi:alpha/beta hydrolase [Pseudonocardia lacus]|uniref:alpha/beta hydrolase n=1 Tax=Pseudonocardia lacus TaxID=2835865 RepID=UPI002029860C|nr:alpha/beta hydrolase [Pseudonocardia lacus]